jgi:hypothetical protein
MKLTNKAILLLIIAVSVGLRFFNFFEIPFTHDEFSALFRLKFDNFSELIEKGVKIDGHPAGIQVFLYYWTGLFGYKEWVVKLPFAIFGIASVFLIYQIGKKWFNETVGLLSAAFIASIQFTIMYSQIARPYISGMFFSLLMIYYWSNLMMSPDKNFNRNSFLFIVSAALCAYNHHFSLLFAVIVSISGLFFIEKKYLIKYLLCGLMIFIAYTPHLNIFFYQLKVGGVEGWLGKPENDFLIEFVYYIFNYSIFVVILTLGILLYGLFYLKKGTVNVKLILLAFVWFILPFLIGFYYSRNVSAVLQYSVLIFSFPLLFFVLFGIIKNQTPHKNFIFVLAILLTNTLALIYNRSHYDLFYKSVYKEILTDYMDIKREKGNTLYLIDSNKKISDYYISKLAIDTTFIDYSNYQNISEFKYFLENEIGKHDKLFFGCLSSVPNNVIPLIQDYFPTIEIQKNYFGGTSYLFSKTNNDKEDIISFLNFESDLPEGWESVDLEDVFLADDYTRGNVYQLNEDAEWGPKFVVRLDEILKNKNNFIDISVKVKAKGAIDELVLVGLLESNGQNIYWGGTELKEFSLLQLENSDWISLHHSIKLSDIHIKHNDILVKIFIWNKGRNNFLIDNFKISLRKGNPIIYGLYHSI